MSSPDVINPDLSNKDAPADTAAPSQVAHPFVHARFRELLKRDGDTQLSAPWKNAFFEPPNPLPPNPQNRRRHPRMKLPVLLAVWIAGSGAAVFLWFSFLR